MVKNNLNPTWKKFTVPLQTFCSSDLERTLKVPPTSTTTANSNFARRQSHDTHPQSPSAGGLLRSRQRRISRSDWLLHHHRLSAAERRSWLAGELSQSNPASRVIVWLRWFVHTSPVSVSQVQFDCIHPEKQKKKKSYKNSGVVSVKNCKVEKTLGLLLTVTLLVTPLLSKKKKKQLNKINT